MKKIILTMFLAACLPLIIAGSAAALGQNGQVFSGTGFLQAPSFGSIQITTSTNVFMLYRGNANGQTYGAYTKNKAGDKYYATGGGGGSSSGIFYKQNDTSVGDTGFSSLSSTCFATSSGWTAQ
jgi:hypothetical protein